MKDDWVSRLRSRDWQEADAALAEAVARPDADEVLAEFVLSATGPQRLMAAAVLGDLKGEAGTAALRRLARATGPGSRDLRCASLLAFAKRCAEDASEDLAEALSDRDGPVKDYAVIGPYAFA